MAKRLLTWFLVLTGIGLIVLKVLQYREMHHPVWHHLAED